MTAFLYPIIVMSAISGGFALMLVLADKFFCDYGDCKLDINEGTRELTVPGGGNLLFSLIDNEIFLPSACGGQATCGFCKVGVSSGGGDVLATELPFLSPLEKKTNIRLSCQLKVKEDMKLFMPSDLLEVKEYRTTVTKIIQCTHDIKEIHFKLEEPNTVSFRPGQYMQIRVPGDFPEPVLRAYSLASNPDDTGTVEMIIRLVPGGICTTYVHNQLKEGDTIYLTGAYGDFYLNEESDCEILGIAGGSGMAPIKSIVKYCFTHNIQRPIRFFFGAVTKKDMYYLDMMKEWSQDHPNYQFIPALSAPAPEDNWEGEVGLITEVLSNHLDDVEDNVEAYLCGSPGMIDACIAVLKRKGMPENRILFDKF